MKLYDRQGTPNAMRVRVVIAEKGLEGTIAYETVDLIGAQQKSAAFLAMNPIGKTPVLVLDDGLALSECVAITEYLDTLDGNPVLTGTTPREKALIHMMHRRAEIMLLDPIDDYFHYGIAGLGPAVAPWRKPEWTEGKSEWGQRRGAEAMTNLPWFEAELGKQPFLTGNRYSMADITLMAAIDFGRGVGPFRAELPPNLARGTSGCRSSRQSRTAAGGTSCPRISRAGAGRLDLAASSDHRRVAQVLTPISR